MYGNYLPDVCFSPMQRAPAMPKGSELVNENES